MNVLVLYKGSLERTKIINVGSDTWHYMRNDQVETHTRGMSYDVILVCGQRYRDIPEKTLGPLLHCSTGRFMEI